MASGKKIVIYSNIKVQRSYIYILSKPLTAHMPTINGDDGARRVCG